MRIKNVQLVNFKRFTDLTLGSIPPTAKLVLLIGANGSGKSSVFDGFEAISNTKKENLSNDFAANYYPKNRSVDFLIKIEFQDGRIAERKKQFWNNNFLNANNFYGRTSFRQIPRLTRTALGQLGRIKPDIDSDRPKIYIEKDNRFEFDIEIIAELILKDFFRSEKTKEEIKSTYITPINNALNNIFNINDDIKLQLLEIIPPLEGKVAQINFKKGDNEFHYDFLSAGEKEVINILLNLLSRKHLYTDTIYFLDEIDLHLSTELQQKFLNEVVENWIPDSCQLWTATHSLGFIDYANRSESAVIFDFSNYNFDIPKILLPKAKENLDIYEIAVSKSILTSLFEGFEIIFVENKDSKYYANVNISKKLFIPENGRNGVYHKVKSGEQFGIVDRDYLSDEDIGIIQEHYQNLKVLNFYSIENYLYHPDNLEDYFQSKQLAFNKREYITLITEEKNKIKDLIIPSIALYRTSYPYFGEPDFNNSVRQNRFKNKAENTAESTVIAGYLNSNEFDIYYKVFSMKSYATSINYRSNIPKSELSETNWFRRIITEFIAR